MQNKRNGKKNVQSNDKNLTSGQRLTLRTHVFSNPTDKQVQLITAYIVVC